MCLMGLPLLGHLKFDEGLFIPLLLPPKNTCKTITTIVMRILMTIDIRSPDIGDLLPVLLLPKLLTAPPNNGANNRISVSAGLAELMEELPLLAAYGLYPYC